MADLVKQVIVSERAPEAVGPYSAGIRAGDFIFTAGQIGIDRRLGRLVEGGVQAEVRQALYNLSSVLEAAGSSLEQVVKTTVFLRDMGDYATVNSIYGEYFASQPPARSAVQVAALPLGAAVEIEAIAIVR